MSNNLLAIGDGKSNYDNSSNGSVTSTISKWKQPGGTLAKLVAVASVIGGGVLLYNLLPSLIALASNIITLSMLVGAFTILVILVSNKKFRDMFSNLYFLAMRRLTGMVIDIDPVNILRKKIDVMKKKMEEMKSSIITLTKMKYRTERKLEEKKILMEGSLKRAVEFKKIGKLYEANMEATQANLNRRIINTYTERLEGLKNWIKIINKLYEYADYTVRKTEMEVEYKTEEFEAIREQHKAFATFKSIVNGSPEEMEDFTRAMESMNNDMDGKLAEIDYYINNTRSLMNSVDIEKAVLSNEASELIEKYEKGGFESIFTAFKENEKIFGEELVETTNLKELEEKTKE